MFLTYIDKYISDSNDLDGVGKVDPYLKAVGIIVHGRCFYVDESNKIKNEEPNGANIKF